MIINVLTGEKLKISNEKLIIELQTEEKKISLKDIKAVIIQNIKTSITISTLLKLNEYNIQTVICNEKKQPQLQLLDLYSNYKVTERINEQINWKEKRKNSCFLEIIKIKLLHQKELLEYFNKFKEAEYITNLLKKMNRKIKSEEIRALEGVGARIYFKGLFGNDFKRFNNDIENKGLNYGYTLIRTLISKIIVSKGLHPSLGIEHKSILNNFNLSDDIIEIFRPLIDYIVVLYINSYIEFEWECKSRLFEVFYQKIKFKDKYYILEQAIEKYVDEIILYLKNEKKKIEFPRLEIDKYEY